MFLNRSDDGQFTFCKAIVNSTRCSTLRVHVLGTLEMELKFDFRKILSVRRHIDVYGLLVYVCNYSTVKRSNTKIRIQMPANGTSCFYSSTLNCILFPCFLLL
jgi:hypothetical protein